MIALVITMVQMSLGAEAQQTAWGMRGTRFIVSCFPIRCAEQCLVGARGSLCLAVNHGVMVRGSFCNDDCNG